MHDVQNAPGPSSSCPDPTEYDHDDHILARVLPTLFIPPERLGWEYRPPTLPIPRANPEPKPILHEHEPPESDVREWLRVQRRGPQTQRVGIGGLIALVVYAIVQGGATPTGRDILTLLVVVGCCYISYVVTVSTRALARLPVGIAAAVATLLAIVVPPLGLLALSLGALIQGWRLRTKKALLAERYNRLQDDLKREHAAAVVAWERRMRAAVEGEERQRLQDPLWYPVPLPAPTRLLSVFGGSMYGWESLLTTFGASVLGRGGQLTILNLSERLVADELCGLATRRDLAVRKLMAPGDLDGLDLLVGLQSGELVNFLVDALHASDNEIDRSGIIRDRLILTTVCASLDPERPLTIDRIRAGLRVLRRREESAGSSLSSVEYGRISRSKEFNDETRQIPAIRQAVLDIEQQLAFFAALVSQSEPTASLGTGSGYDLCLLEIPREREFLDNAFVADFLFQLLLRSFRFQRQADTNPKTVLIVGAERIAGRHLRELAKAVGTLPAKVERGGLTRLVYLFERLGKDSHDLLGLGGGAVGFMRLDNHKDADEACAYIGRDHEFKVAGLTQSTNRSVTHSIGSSESTGTMGVAGGPTIFGGVPYQADTPATRSWGRSRGIAEGTGDGTATSVQRVYDLKVEPRQIQGLPETAICYVDMQGSQEPLFIDCNPDIVSLDRVSPDPIAPQQGLAR